MRQHKITPEQRELLRQTRDLGVLSIATAEDGQGRVDELQELGLLRRAPGGGAPARYVLSGEGIAALRD